MTAAGSGQAVAGWLMLAGPLVGLIPVAHPSLLRIWSLPQAAFVQAVAAHRVVWAWLNAGFVLASAATTAGSFALASSMSEHAESAMVLASATTYGIAAVLWCAVLAIRTRTTPLLGDLGPDVLDSPPARPLAEATTALFQAFVLITAVALAALGATLAFTGTAPAWTAAVLLLTGVASAVWLLRTGDVIPAVLYLPTMLLGLTLI